MTRVFPTIEKIPWRELGRSGLRIVVMTTAAGLMTSGKYIYIAGVALRQFAEEKLAEESAK